MIGFTQMGHIDDVEVVGRGTVRMGSPVDMDMGALKPAFLVREGEDGDDVGLPSFAPGGVEGRFARLTLEVCFSAERRGDGEEGDAAGFLAGSERPAMTGGGSSRPSAAFRDSWRAKSDACHHSRNLRAKIEVGRRMRRLDRSLGRRTVVNVRGFQMLLLWPGREAGLPAAGFGFVTASIAA